ncbi:energy-coupling factor ABC transporter ATP-binding protein [Candidatus Thorarchaeota archaeon]|nr:MAG: energy-coupling factor ABC transporter ATP-binding protein [Candidatus Thorarchaeota archaeon]
MTCAIDINHVFFRYNEFRMEDINLNLHVGEQKAIVGLNGSGKTTLFKLLLGLLKPDSGDIFVFDRKVTRDNLWEVRQNIGFLFQNPDDQLFAPTVWEDVAFGPRNLGLSEEEVSERVEWALDRVGMSKFIGRPVNQMSHGQAKRVALAGVIAMRPAILVLDEPFTGLDFKMVQTMIDIIQKLRQEGISILYTTHNRFFIENWSDSVAVIEDGRIIYDGPTKEAITRKEVIDNIGDWNQLREQIVSYRTNLI